MLINASFSADGYWRTVLREVGSKEVSLIVPFDSALCWRSTLDTLMGALAIPMGPIFIEIPLKLIHVGDSHVVEKLEACGFHRAFGYPIQRRDYPQVQALATQVGVQTRQSAVLYPQTAIESESTSQYVAEAAATAAWPG